MDRRHLEITHLDGYQEIQTLGEELNGLAQEEKSLAALLEAAGRTDSGYFDDNTLSNLLVKARANRAAYYGGLEKMDELVKGFRAVAERVQDLLKEVEDKDELP